MVKLTYKNYPQIIKIANLPFQSVHFVQTVLFNIISFLSQYSHMLGEKTSPLKRTRGLRCENDFIAAQKRAAPPTGSMTLGSILYTSLK
jgi:hypothetical protein